MYRPNVSTTRGVVVIAILIVTLLIACNTTPGSQQSQSTAVPTTSAPPTESPASATPPPTEPPAATETVAREPTESAQPAESPFPPPPTGVPEGILPPEQPLGNVVALAWNDLGMHCYMRDYSLFMVLPPYNTLWTQVFRRSDDEPHMITQGVEVAYSVPQVSEPQAHTNFWEYASAYGLGLEPGIGLAGFGTSGTMEVASGALSNDHFVAEGIPLVDRNDDGTWDPYPMAVVEVRQNGQVVAQTVNVAPVSTEMRCDFCHGGNIAEPATTAANILRAHDGNEGTDLLAQAQGGDPVFCADCHADPAMGVMENQATERTLSGAIHTWHSLRVEGLTQVENACQACHPGPVTQCQRGAMAAAGIECQDCHGGMEQVGDPARTPWVNLPRCQSCHTEQLTRATNTTIDIPNANLTASAAELYRNSVAHGEESARGGTIYCAACHGSPHAIYPSTLARDNVQSIRLQGEPGTIDDCGVCHGGERPDDGFWHFDDDEGRERDGDDD